MRAAAPSKHFIAAPTAGNSATCKSCAHCPWMAMNELAGLAQVLEHGRNEITLDPALGRRAKTPIDRMLARSEEHTSELQSLMRISYAVFCLKKKKNNTK